MTSPGERLHETLLEPVSPAVHQALMSASAEAEAQAGGGRSGLHFRRISGRALGIIAGVTLSGAVIAAAAVPFALDVLFPPPVSTSFTFESGTVCDLDIKVTPDFATSDSPEAAMDVAQRFISNLDVSALPIQRALDHPSGERSALIEADKAASDAREAAGLPDVVASPYAAESSAVFDTVVTAIWAELADKGMQGGVSIESRISCK